MLAKICGGPQRREPILSETLAQWKRLAEADLGPDWQGIWGEVVEISCQMLFFIDSRFDYCQSEFNPFFDDACFRVRITN